MKLSDAKNKLDKLTGKKFSEILLPVALENIKINKGKSGQILENLLGMKLSNGNLDFEDGELKTNKCDACGNSKETVAITQISSHIDNFISNPPKKFEETHLYEKISNLLFVPVCKDGSPENWFFMPSRHVDLSKNKELHRILEEDYYSICAQLRQQVESGDNLHTANGKFLQVRTKDSTDSSGNYHSIYSNNFNRIVSDKNRAFYFKKDFMSYLNTGG